MSYCSEGSVQHSISSGRPQQAFKTASAQHQIPQTNPTATPGPTERATSIFFSKPSGLVKLDSFVVWGIRHTTCINTASFHASSRKASSVCLCVKWIREGSMSGHLSLHVLTRSCCPKETSVSYLTGEDVLRTRLSETWMHLSVSLFAGVFFFYTRAGVSVHLSVPPADLPRWIRAREEGTPGSRPG